MTGFTDVFGGSVLQPQSVSYLALALTASASLDWPLASSTGTDFVAAVLDVTPSTGGFTLSMPPANQVSPGFATLMSNKGADNFTVTDFDGNVLTVMVPGDVRFFYITDNSTEAGAWQVILFGASSAQLSAGQVAGMGLVAIGGLLNQSADVTSFAASGNLITSDRTITKVWTGGAGTLTLLSASSAGDGFFFELRNQGTGVLAVTAQGGQNIDASGSISLQPSESCFIHCDGDAWYTVGRGRNTQFNFTQLVKAVSTGTYTLTPTEAQNVVQRYTGALSGNVIIVVPAVVQVYYILNQTTNNFTFTIESPTPGSVVTVPSGQSVVVFCDGVNCYNAATVSSGGVSSLTIPYGSVAGPSINLSGAGSTGFYGVSSTTMGYSSAGTNTVTFSATGVEAVLGGTTPKAAHVTTLGASGAVNLADVLKITGVATASSLLDAKAGINVTGTAAVTGNLTVSGTIVGNVTGTITHALLADAIVSQGALATLNSADVPHGGTGVVTLTSGGVVIGAGTGPVTVVAPGSSGNILQDNGTAWVSVTPNIPRGYIDGNIMSTAGSSTTLTTAAGQAADQNNVILMSTSNALAKTTSSWAVGTATGGRARSAASVDGTWQHFYRIRRPDTGVVDVCYDTSATGLQAASYVAGGGNVNDNYTQFHRIGAGLLSGGNWVLFVQTNDVFEWVPSFADITTISGTATLRTLAHVPSGIIVNANIAVIGVNSSGDPIPTANHWNPALGTTPPTGAGLLEWFFNQSSGASSAFGINLQIATNTAQQIYNKQSAGSYTGYSINVLGWVDPRGRNA